MHKHKTRIIRSTKMTETCEMRDTLVSNSGVAKGMPGRLPNACCALPPNL